MVDDRALLRRTTVMHRRVLLGLTVLGVIACDATDPSPTMPTAPASGPAPSTAPTAPAPSTAPIVSTPVAPTATPEPQTPPTPPPLLEPSAPVGPRFAVFFRETPRKRWQMLAITSTEPRAMWIVDADGGGTAGQGHARPSVSPDGRHVAYFHRGMLWVAAQDGTHKRKVTEHERGEVRLLVSGFTPDGAALLFHQDAVESEDGALPEGVTEGFQRFDLASGTTTPVDGLEAFETFTADGKVIFSRDRDDRGEVLVRATLSSPLVEETLLSTNANLGFSQLTVSHGVAVWGELHEPSRSRMFAARLDGTLRRELMPATEWAQVQWPRFAPDGSQLAYTDDRALMRMSLVGEAPMPTPERLTRCSHRCEFRWEGSRSLLVVDGTELVRVSIGDDGVAVRTPVAPDVVGLAVAGERD